jgi:hypothetical protein
VAELALDPVAVADGGGELLEEGHGSGQRVAYPGM